MNHKLNYYQEKLNSDDIRNEFVFYLKEKLQLNDNDIYVNKERELSKNEHELIKEFIEKKKE